MTTRDRLPFVFVACTHLSFLGDVSGGHGDVEERAATTGARVRGTVAGRDVLFIRVLALAVSVWRARGFAVSCQNWRCFVFSVARSRLGRARAGGVLPGLGWRNSTRTRFGSGA